MPEQIPTGGDTMNDAEDWLAQIKADIASRPLPKPTGRCRIFGHKWGAWLGGTWHTPLWVVGGATRHLYCKRCEVGYHDVNRPRPAYRVR